MFFHTEIKNFDQKCKFWTKVKILIRKLNFWWKIKMLIKKIKFWWKIKFLTKNKNVLKINLNFLSTLKIVIKDDNFDQKVKFLDEKWKLNECAKSFTHNFHCQFFMCQYFTNPQNSIFFSGENLVSKSSLQIEEISVERWTIYGKYDHSEFHRDERQLSAKWQF